MGDDDEQLVLSTIENSVGYVTINRPSAFNAMSLPLAEQFLSAVEAMAGDDSVRAVVVRGEGKIFSAGGDIKQMLSDVEAGDRAAYFREPLASFNRMAVALRELPKPVVTAVHGASGLEVAELDTGGAEEAEIIEVGEGRAVKVIGTQVRVDGERAGGAGDVLLDE